MAVRCYIPTTLAALDKGLDTAIAVAPDTAVADLRPDDAEESEFAAMSIAAALAARAGWTVDVHDRRERPAGAVSTHHVHDVVLRARRAG